MPVLQNLGNCCEPHGACESQQETSLIKGNLQQTEDSPECWYLSRFVEGYFGLITVLEDTVKGNQKQT